jgi:hypothetical protein
MGLSMNIFMEAAIEEAQQGLIEGGSPKAIIGENKTFMGKEQSLFNRGLELDAF